MKPKLINMCKGKKNYHRSHISIHNKENRKGPRILHMQAMQKQRKTNLTNLTCLYPNVHKSHVQNINIASIYVSRKNKSS